MYQMFTSVSLCLVLCKLQGVTIVKPIVFGNVARYFGKKREEDGHTHQWSVYVKPYRNEVSYVEHNYNWNTFFFLTVKGIICSSVFLILQIM